MSPIITARRVPNLLGVLAIVVTALLTPAIAAAQEVELLPVDELLAAPESFDGAEVTLEGELVGDYGFRGNGVMWTQLNDDSYARAALVDGGPRTGSNIGVGVRMPSILGRDLDPAGGYRLEGPVVQLTGIWRYHDPDRGGESYLDVTSLAVIEEGRRIQEGPDWVVFALGAMLIAATIILWRRQREIAAAEE